MSTLDPHAPGWDASPAVPNLRTRSHAVRTAGRVGAAAGAAFLASAVWYTVLAEPYAALLPADATADAPSPATMLLVELGRSLIVAAALTLALRRMTVRTRRGALGLAVATWLAFPVVLLTGSVVHEGVAPQLAAIHAGDWLLKLVVVALLVRTRRDHRKGW